MVMSKNNSKWLILFKFESGKDRDEVLKGLSTKHTITWNNDTMESEFSVDLKTFTVHVEKGKQSPLKPLIV
jgi:hypothetical protein